MQVLYSNLTKKQEQYLLSSFNSEGISTRRFRGKLIGSGATARVYSYNSDKIIRVQTTKEDYPASHHFGWVKLCLERRFKVLPKYSFVAVDDPVEPDYIITVTERLVDAEKFLFNQSQDWDFVACELSNLEVILDSTLNGDYPECTGLALRKTKLRKSSLRSIGMAAHENGVYLNDIHSGNFMFRRNGQLVITDPCC